MEKPASQLRRQALFKSDLPDRQGIDTVVTAPNRIRFHTGDVHLLLEKIHSECFRNTMLSPVLPILRNNMPDRRL